MIFCSFYATVAESWVNYTWFIYLPFFLIKFTHQHLELKKNDGRILKTKIYPGFSWRVYSLGKRVSSWTMLVNLCTSGFILFDGIGEKPCVEHLTAGIVTVSAISAGHLCLVDSTILATIGQVHLHVVHCVVCGVESMEWSLGVQFWSGVESNFGVAKNDLSFLNRQQKNTGALTWLHSLDVFICPAIFWRIEQNHLPLQNLTPLHSNTPLQNRFDRADKQLPL